MSPTAAPARSRTARPVPRWPRRMSGPAAGVVAVPAPRLPPAPPRRRDAPGQRRPAHGRRTRSHSGGTWRLRQTLLDLPDHRLLDRLIRGRAWIGLLAFALIGIVAMQVSLLKLNTGIGRAVQRASVLQRENAALRAQVSRLSSTDRVQAAGQRLGLVLAPAGEVLFLVPHPGDARRASSMVRAVAPTPLAGGPGAASTAAAPLTSGASTPTAAGTSAASTSAAPTSAAATSPASTAPASPSPGPSAAPAPTPSSAAPAAVAPAAGAGR